MRARAKVSCIQPKPRLLPGEYAKSKYQWMLQIDTRNKALEFLVFFGRFLCYSVSERTHAGSHTVLESMQVGQQISGH